MKNSLLFLSLVLLALTACNRQQSATILSLPSAPKVQKANVVNSTTSDENTNLSNLQKIPQVHRVHPKEHYRKAFENIRKMLRGETPLDFKKAVFMVENAYFDNRMDEAVFEQLIQGAVAWVNTIQASTELQDYEGYSDKGAIQKNMAIYRFLADTLYLNEQLQILPYSYNFEDATGQQQWANMFVSKLLGTGEGNCHSLAFLYKILAEELGAPAYFCLTPNHIYLTHPSKKVGWYNTELTSRSFPTDAWIQTAGYVTVEQIRSRLYMENLDLKASVALTLVDLVQGYQRRFGTDIFVGEMLEEVLLHHPKNVNALLLQVDYLQHQYRATQNPKLYSQLKQTVKQLVDWGYLPLPKEAEESGLGSDEEASFTPQYAQNNPHPKYRNDESRKNALTLSNGRYDEFLEAERIMQVASVVWDNELGEIVGFEDGEKGIGVVSRWLSTDPLERNYPSHSPYNYVINNPINAIDPDGRDVFLLIWNSKPGTQGHTAFAIENYKTIIDDNGNEKYEKDGTYTVFEVYPVSDGELSDFVRNPNRVTAGRVQMSKVESYNDLYNKELISDKRKVGGIVKFDTESKDDIYALSVLESEETKLTQKWIDNGDGPLLMVVPESGAVKYALTEEASTDNCTFSCASYAVKSLELLYNISLGNPERITTKGGTIRYGLLGGNKVNISSMDLNAYTPNRIFKDASKKGEVVKGEGTNWGSFLDSATGGQIKDENPNQ